MLLERYIIGKVLGRGGFGITYLAYDTSADKKVAVKEYFPGMLAYRTPGSPLIISYTGEKKENYSLGAEKFYHEAKTLSRFNGSTNIINVSEFFYQNNTAYYVMEYIDGMDLRTYIEDHGGRLSYEDLKPIMHSILYALVIVHSLDVLHRDISPDNIYVTKRGEIKLLDFGSARQLVFEQSNSLSVMFKQGFTPLEQYRKHGNHGPWTDIYSFGATLYYALTGVIPEESINRMEKDELLPPSALGADSPPEFEEILMKMLALKPENRYLSAVELKEAMRKLDDPESEENEGCHEKAPFWLNINKRYAALVGIGLLLIVLIVLAASISAFSRMTVKHKTYELETSNYIVETVYTGQWKNSSPNGEGEMIVTDDRLSGIPVGTTFKGKFINGLLQGPGEERCQGVYSYFGEFKNGLYHGWGELEFASGEKYTGNFSLGYYSGEGRLAFPDGGYYKGQFQNGAMHGKGVKYSSSGIILEDGYWINGVFIESSQEKLLSESPAPAKTFAPTMTPPPTAKPSASPAPSESEAAGGNPSTSPSGSSSDTPNPSSGAYQQTAWPAFTGQDSSEPPTQSPPSNPPLTSEPANPPGAERVINKPYSYSTRQFTVYCSYSGYWQNNAPNGEGTLTFLESGSSGRITWFINDQYTGNFKNGLLEGDGVFISYNGDSMSAFFINGVATGYGEINYASGATYHGNFVDGIIEGEGEMASADGSYYKGSFSGGLYDGFGYYEDSEGLSYEGEFKNGTFNGQGTTRDANGYLIQSGRWINGQFAGF
jgi:serine/threonine protein kinase